MPADQSQASAQTMRIDILSMPESRHARKNAAPQPPQPRIRETSKRPLTKAADSNFEELFQRVYDGALITNLDGLILDANERALEALGCDLSALLEVDIIGIIMGANSTLMHTLRENLRKNRFTLIQAYCRRQDGVVFPSEIAVSRLAICGRDHICFFIRDITRRLQAEESLRQERNLLRTLIDLLPDYIYVKDVQNRFIIANMAVSSLLGSTPEGVVGRSDHDFFPAEQADAFEADEQRIVATGIPLINKEESCIDFQGRRRLLLTTKVALKEPDGRITGIVGIGKDVTKQRLMEAQRAQAQKMESIGQLAAGIAHEINTPIQYVGDNTRFLRDAFNNMQTMVAAIARLLDGARGEESPASFRASFEETCAKADYDFLVREIPSAIEQTLEGVTRVSRIVHAMKEFSHPDSNEKLPADINRAIESTITVSRNEWKYVAELVTDFDPELPPVPCYLGHFNQVILNLIVNAAQAITEKVGDGARGKGRILISTRADGDSVEIRVKDDGRGIPSAIQHRIFEPFFTTKDVGKGSGQGLSTCHAIIAQKHAGSIVVESEEGRGATFILRLPIAAAQKN